MLRKFFCAAAAAGVLALGSAGIFAEGEVNANLLSDYRNLTWTGDQIYYDDYSAAVYFANADKENQSAAVTLDVEQGMTGFMFRIDGGNGAGEGFGTSSGIEDSGFCTVTFYDSEHKVIFSISTGKISGFENYSRFSIGEETSYYPIPEGAKTVEIALTAEQKGDTKKVHMYFRNLALFFSSEIPLSPADSNTLYMNASGGLSRVEVGISPYERYLWIGIVFLVAMTFFGIGVWRQRYKTAKVMKGTDWRRR